MIYPFFHKLEFLGSYKIYLIFKFKYIQNKIKLTYLILTIFIKLENIVFLLFNIINKKYRFFILKYIYIYIIKIQIFD